MRSRQQINGLYKQEDAKRKVSSEGGKQNSVSLTKDGAKAGGRGAATKLVPWMESATATIMDDGTGAKTCQ